MDFEIVNDWTQQALYKCQLQAHQIAYSASRHMNEAGIGYGQMNLYEDHPLLWKCGPSHYYTLHERARNGIYM
ncbi:hypothetical protein GCM10027347_51460 [Larkinella harenae]